jgi:hypothetical protein
MLQNWIGSMGRFLTRRREGFETQTHEDAKLAKEQGRKGFET